MKCASKPNSEGVVGWFYKFHACFVHLSTILCTARLLDRLLDASLRRFRHHQGVAVPRDAVVGGVVVLFL